MAGKSRVTYTDQLIELITTLKRGTYVDGSPLHDRRKQEITVEVEHLRCNAKAYKIDMDRVNRETSTS